MALAGGLRHEEIGFARTVDDESPTVEIQRGQLISLKGN